MAFGILVPQPVRKATGMATGPPGNSLSADLYKDICIQGLTGVRILDKWIVVKEKIISKQHLETGWK